MLTRMYCKGLTHCSCFVLIDTTSNSETQASSLLLVQNYYMDVFQLLHESNGKSISKFD